MNIIDLIKRESTDHSVLLVNHKRIRECIEGLNLRGGIQTVGHGFKADVYVMGESGCTLIPCMYVPEDEVWCVEPHQIEGGLNG